MKAKYETPLNLSDSLVDLLKKILTANPNKRYSIKQILQHPWIQNVGNNGSEYKEAIFKQEQLESKQECD